MATQNDVSACLIQSKTYLMGFIFPPNNEIIYLNNKYVINRFAIVDWIIRISIFITINMGFNFFPFIWEY